MPRKAPTAKLDSALKERLIKNAQEVYFGYLKLEALKSETVNKLDIKINGNKTSIINYLQDSKNPLPATINLGSGHELKMAINPEGKLTFKTDPEVERKPNPAIKGLAQYTPNDITQLLTGSTFSIQESPNGEKTISTTIDNGGQPLEIGGQNKLSLYRLHISNLGQIIKHLQSPNADTNMLVSLTTGSGKTFSQALWMMVLHMSKVKGVFGVPDKLVKQYKDDLERLIPHQLMDEIKQSNEEGIIIDSVDNLLLNRFDELKNSDPKNTLFSFDEAHLLALRENLFVKAKTLANNFVNLYLTATPTPALSEIAKGHNKKPSLTVVATMNNEQKVKEGYAERSISYSAQAKSIPEMGKTLVLSLAERLGRWLADAIDPQKGYNAANAFGESYLYNIAQKPFFNSNNPVPVDHEQNLRPKDILRKAARWNLQLSAFQGKTLICANHFEDIVNLDLFLNQMAGQPVDSLPRPNVHDDLSAPKLSDSYYANANTFNRNNTYHFLQMSEEVDGVETNVDTKIYEGYANGLHQQFQQEVKGQITQLAGELNITLEDARDYEALTKRMIEGLAHAPITNSMHAIIDLTLSVLAAHGAKQEPKLDSLMQEFGGAYLDKKRFNELAKFSREIHSSANSLELDLIKFLTYDPETNSKGIAAEEAEKLAAIMSKIIRQIKQNPYPESPMSQSLVDNWYADQEVLHGLGKEIVKDMHAFAKNNYKQFVFAEVEKNETIVADEVFTAFNEETHTVGMAEKREEEDADYKAKPRAKRAVEALNTHAQESVYKPVTKASDASAKQKIEMTDNLFRLGITTMYATDKKVEGFNDPNLHQVAVVAHSDENTLANPANIIQAYGRNRGLNPYKVPNFFLVAQKEVNCLFGVEELNKPDYQSDYDQGIRGFKRNYIKKLGQELGNEILVWIEKNKNALHEVDDEQLSAAVVEHCFDILEKLNQANSFKFDLTQKDFVIALDYAIGHLKKKQEEFKTGTTLPFLVRVVGSLMHFFANTLRWLAAREPKKQLKRIYKGLAREVDEDSKVVQLHYKITTIPIEEIWEHNLSRKIVLMNIVNEAKSLNEIRDKYYSAIFLKPLDVLEKEQKAIIKKDYPELKILVEGIFSYVALATAQEKEQILAEVSQAIADNDHGKIAHIATKLKELEINIDHPEKKLHSVRIQEMLTMLGYDKNQVKNLPEAIGLIKTDATLDQKITGKVISNQAGLKHLRPNMVDAQAYMNQVKKLIVSDIKKLVEPLITDPSYIKMLSFIEKYFTKDDLFTINRDPDRMTVIPDQIIKFIQDVNTRGDEDSFYEEYFLPKDDELKNGDFKPDKVPFFSRTRSIDTLFDVLQESNLRFYKVTSQGEVKDASIDEQRFFNSKDPTKLTVPKAVDNYDIVAENYHGKKPFTVYITLVMGEDEAQIIKIRQVNAQGESKVFRRPIENLDVNKFRGVQGSLKKYFSHDELIAINNAIVTPDESEEPGESILSPALSDQHTEKGKVWRQIFGLNSLKAALPTINEMGFKTKEPELAKAVEVSSKVLEGIKKGEKFTTSDSLITHARLFSQAVKQESQAFKQEKRNPDPDKDTLGGKQSRVEKIKEQFQKKKEDHYHGEIDDDTKKIMIERMKSYINSRAKTQIDDKRYTRLTGLRSNLFFNDKLTIQKLYLATDFINKLDKMGNNYNDILKLLENTSSKNKKVLEAFDKDPLSNNELDTALGEIKAILMDATPKKPEPDTPPLHL